MTSSSRLKPTRSRRRSFDTLLNGLIWRPLADFPQRGMRRDDLRPGLRVLGFRRRVTIAFEVRRETVVVLGVYYGGQDWERTLRQSDSSSD